MTALAWLLSAHLLAAAPPTPIEEAEVAFAALRYDLAEGMAKVTLTEAASSPNDRARAHRVLGQLAAIRGEPATAEEHFLRMLEADRTVVVEERASPKIRGPFEAALARLPPPGVEPPAPKTAPEPVRAPAPARPAPDDATTSTSRRAQAAAQAAEEDEADVLLLGGLGAAGIGVVAGLVGVTVLLVVLSQQDGCAGAANCVTPP